MTVSYSSNLVRQFRLLASVQHVYADLKYVFGDKEQQPNEQASLGYNNYTSFFAPQGPEYVMYESVTTGN